MSKKVIGVVIVVVVVLGLAGFGVWAFQSGHLTWSNNSNTVSGDLSSNAVCGSDKVSKFNEAYTLSFHENTATATQDTAGLEALRKDITAASGYKNDATCQNLLFLIAINQQKYDDGKAALAALKSLHDKGVFPDNNIRGNDSVSLLENSLYPLSPDAGYNPQDTSNAK